MHHFHTNRPYEKPMLRQIDWWGQNGPITKKRILSVTTLLVWNFFFSLKPLIKNWFNVPTTQMSIFLLFVRTAVLFDGALSLRVSKYGQSSKWKFVKAGVSQVSVLRPFFSHLNQCLPQGLTSDGKHFANDTSSAWKVSKYEVFSGPYFLVFGLVFLVSSPNTGKYGPEKTPYLDTFHAVFLVFDC